MIPRHPLRRLTLSHVLLLGSLLALGACAAAMPGYSPSGPTKSMGTDDFGRMEGGTYVMSTSEKALDCKHMTGSMHITIARLKDRNQTGAPSDMSTTMKKSFSPWFGGSSYNNDPDGEVARERAKLDAYNRELAARGCPTVDVTAELAKPADGGVKRY